MNSGAYRVDVGVLAADRLTVPEAGEGLGTVQPGGTRVSDAR